MRFDYLKNKRKIVMLTAYDYQMAKILDAVGIDIILVGDSLGMVVLGHKDTKSVAIEEMIHHTGAVARGAKNTPIVGDMPIGSYNTSQDALKNARRFLRAGAQGVKIEGARSKVIKTLLDNNIPVMGHVGLLPQTAERYHLIGKKREEAERIFKEAVELDQLGVFAVVLECIPEDLAKSITEKLGAPTIGIGAGKYCDGQVLVINDMLGFDDSFSPKYLKRYAHLGREIKKAVAKFKREVLNETYPNEEYTYH